MIDVSIKEKKKKTNKKIYRNNLKNKSIIIYSSWKKRCKLFITMNEKKIIFFTIAYLNTFDFL